MSKTFPTNRNAYIITGPTSGIGRLTALELAKRGTVFLWPVKLPLEGDNRGRVVAETALQAAERYSAE